MLLALEHPYLVPTFVRSQTSTGFLKIKEAKLWPLLVIELFGVTENSISDLEGDNSEKVNFGKIYEANQTHIFDKWAYNIHEDIRYVKVSPLSLKLVIIITEYYIKPFNDYCMGKTEFL